MDITVTQVLEHTGCIYGGYFSSPPSLVTFTLAVIVYLEGYWASRASYKRWGVYLQFTAILGTLGLSVESALYGGHALAALALAFSGAGAWLTWRLISANLRKERSK